MNTTTKPTVALLHQQLFEMNRKHITALLQEDVSHLNAQQSAKYYDDRSTQLLPLIGSTALLLSIGFQTRLASKSLDGETAIDLRKDLEETIVLLAKCLLSTDEVILEGLRRAEELWQKLLN